MQGHQLKAKTRKTIKKLELRTLFFFKLMHTTHA